MGTGGKLYNRMVGVSGVDKMGGCFWGHILSGSVESLADDKPKFGGGTVGYFGGNSNRFD